MSQSTISNNTITISQEDIKDYDIRVVNSKDHSFNICEPKFIFGNHTFSSQREFIEYVENLEKENQLLKEQISGMQEKLENLHINNKKLGLKFEE